MQMERRERLRKLLAEREAAGDETLEGASLIGQVRPHLWCPPRLIVRIVANRGQQCMVSLRETGWGAHLHKLGGCCFVYISSQA
jgi:hypothetical protein